MAITYEIIQFESEQIIKRIDENEIVSYIPINESNSDYQAYLTWKAEQPNA